MKVIVLLALVAYTHANAIGYGHAAVGIANTGASAVQRTDDGYGNYAFSYKENGATGGTSRAEAGDAHGNKKGSYSLGVIDGRERVVDYVADGHGFRASVRTNEPGTAPLAPAAVVMHAPDAVGIAAATAKAAAPTLAGLAAGPVIGYGGYGHGGYAGYGAGLGYAGGLGYGGYGYGGHY
ncbi:adult-specific rigid cuticular protein 15.7-like [Brevipalpus obovatus]|uniref:adult-specific rigid cuticular protein 15.7-like n=1 Tax=Brevipalpus obovatus TaxID=246614 RepID=UPI003D9EEC0E